MFTKVFSAELAYCKLLDIRVFSARHDANMMPAWNISIGRSAHQEHRWESWMLCEPNLTRTAKKSTDILYSYGTYDHLILLLARLTNFSSKDLSRKRRMVKLNGAGQSGVPPGMFAGMMPASDKVPMPAGFSPPRETSPRSNDPEEMDLEILTAEACQEWESLVKAFDNFKTYFGPEFQALAEDVYPTKPTPFGPAAHYRTYSIAGIWMNYYMGYIMLHRAHPTMPPVAMMAAGMAAPRTAPFAKEIGRIAAGLEENISRLAVVSTLMGAALIESAFCLFVAGIQVRISFFRGLYEY